jgi:hypothetical protein
MEMRKLTPAADQPGQPAATQRSPAANRQRQTAQPIPQNAARAIYPARRQTGADAIPLTFLPRMTLPTGLLPRKTADFHGLVGRLPNGAALPLLSPSGNYVPAQGAMPARYAPGHPATNGAQESFFGAATLPLSLGAILPQSPAQSARAGETNASFPGISPAFSHPSSGTAPGRAGIPASMTQLLPPSGNPAATPSSATSQPSAAIVYRKETPVQQEQQPVPPAISQDIEFIKKTVKRSDTTTHTIQTNTAINLPGSGSHTQQSAALPRDLDRQVNAIADKVYSALERRLRSEQMRKGLL